jgi:hypothetical protein
MQVYAALRSAPIRSGLVSAHTPRHGMMRQVGQYMGVNSNDHPRTLEQAGSDPDWPAGAA